MDKIYISGPSEEKNSLFIKKMFPHKIMEDLLVETQEMEIPETYKKMYIILDETEASIIWQRFYFENSENDKLTLVKKT